MDAISRNRSCFSAPPKKVSHIGFDEFRFRKLSRLIYTRVMKHRKKRRHERMDRIASAVDNSAPKAYSMGFLKDDQKRKSKLIEKSKRIALENKLLLDKMIHTLATQNIDNRNHVLRHSRSLTNDGRSQFSKRINHENKILSRRIKQAKASMNYGKFEVEHKKHTKFMLAMSEFWYLHRDKAKAKRKAKKNARSQRLEPLNTPPSSPARPVTAPAAAGSNTSSVFITQERLSPMNQRPPFTLRPSSALPGLQENSIRLKRLRHRRPKATDVVLARKARVVFSGSMPSSWKVQVIELGIFHRSGKKVFDCCKGLRLVMHRLRDPKPSAASDTAAGVAASSGDATNGSGAADSSGDNSNSNSNKSNSNGNSNSNSDKSNSNSKVDAAASEEPDDHHAEREKRIARRQAEAMAQHEKQMRKQQLFVSIDTLKAVCTVDSRVTLELLRLKRRDAITGKFSRISEQFVLGSKVMSALITRLLSEMRIDNRWKLFVAWGEHGDSNAAQQSHVPVVSDVELTENRDDNGSAAPETDGFSDLPSPSPAKSRARGGGGRGGGVKQQPRATSSRRRRRKEGGQSHSRGSPTRPKSNARPRQPRRELRAGDGSDEAEGKAGGTEGGAEARKRPAATEEEMLAATKMQALTRGRGARRGARRAQERRLQLAAAVYDQEAAALVIQTHIRGLQSRKKKRRHPRPRAEEAPIHQGNEAGDKEAQREREGLTTNAGEGVQDAELQAVKDRPVIKQSDEDGGYSTHDEDAGYSTHEEHDDDE